ncbi:hypothetical protein D3C79_772920 [compost metagenome]
MKVNQLTHVEFVRATLKAGGLDAEALTAFLSEDQLSAEEVLCRDRILSAAEALNMAWIVSRLKKIADGQDAQAAVQALATLAAISPFTESFHAQLLLK